MGSAAPSLERRCVEGVHPEDRRRGREYFRLGRVLELVPTSTGAVSLVEGSRTYRVAIDGQAARNGCLHVSCDCPRFEDGRPCKHVWATVLAMDAQRESWRVRGTNGLSVHGADAFDDDLLIEDEDEDEEFYLETPSVDAPNRRDPRPNWKHHFRHLEMGAEGRRAEADAARRRRPVEVLYRLDMERSRVTRALVVELFKREIPKSGRTRRLRPFGVSEADLETLPDDDPDTDLLRLLLSVGKDSASYGWGYTSRSERVQSVRIPAVVAEIVLKRLCPTGRFFIGEPPRDGSPIVGLEWDDGPPWSLALQVRFNDDTKRELEALGWLSRENERISHVQPITVLDAGFLVFRDRIGRLESRAQLPWLSMLRDQRPSIPATEARMLVETIWAMSDAPPIELPPELTLEEIREEPTPWARVRTVGARGRLEAEIAFDYGVLTFGTDDHRRGVVHDGKVVVRDRDRERQRLASLTELGLRERGGEWTLAMKDFARVVAALIADGFVVEAEGIRYRGATSSSYSVKSGIDWLELDGAVDFGGQSMALPEILQALARGEGYVRLGDGSHGMLPEAWLARVRTLSDLEPSRDGDKLRFRRSQALLLDVLLAEQGEVHHDRDVARLRERLQGFDGVEPEAEPRGFSGKLRGYQREGLGWLAFLSELGFGGCLADDMGLGKTIQVLALLQRRKSRHPSERREKKPSLVVVPRSLVHNWLDEATRFTPRLRVVDYSGVHRGDVRDELAKADVLLTTYGVLRKDIATLREIALDYAILDEAQAIKNRGSQAAKAARLLRADHRLAVTGTPVENHLGELGSIFEFLNPGMLGKLARKTGGSALGSTLADAEILAPALRPFILRRKKEEVLKDLPPKSEQTVFCVLERAQRKLYDELRSHYQRTLKQHIDQVGLGRAKIRVIEALLRLRQAACHPALLDPDRGDEGSAKLDRLLEQLSEVVEEGHKALVFSQFTRFLAIVRRRLDQRGIEYEYLDGRTQDRKERVARFQSQSDCPLFLVSLKAGGLGLNLTAADYVFLLDPWWNPASESQAIDRAHRIGQTRSVFAYRLIAEDTVEERILELQEHKRELAEAIVSEKNSIVRALTAEDLELLLS
jgi:superfamily II DNA or RNA helicase